MSNQEIVEIILKAIDNASGPSKKVEKQMDKIGDAAQKSNTKAANSSQRFQQKIEETKNKLNSTVDKFNEVGNKGASSFKKLSSSQQDSIVKFNMLDKETQATLQAIRELGVESMDLIPGADSAIQKLASMDEKVHSFGGSFDYAKSKMELMGATTNGLKGKIQTTGIAIQTYIGAKWDGIKQKVTSVAQVIKGKIGSAIDSVKTKLGGLGGGFNKLKEGAQSAGQGLSFLKSTASMAAGMVGFELFNGLIQAGKSSIESASRLDYFAGRLNMSSQKTQTFRNDLDELQQRFRKVDMTAVGASAEELSVKLGMGSDSLTEMSETLAVASSAFVAEGRTQEDAILAVSDAIDGQWAKLKELGITQEDIKNNGWTGDLNDKKTLLEGLNNTLEKMGFTKTAEDIVTLDDAFQALSVAGGILLQKILVPLTPILLKVMGYFLDLAYAVGNVVTFIQDNGWLQGPILIGAVAVALGLLAGAAKVAEVSIIELIISAMPGFIVSLYEAAAGFLAISYAGAPLWAIVAVVAAIAIAVYELGIYFGWWKDVGTMIEAVRAGLGRLWAAFINNPNVKGFIQDLTNLWNGLCDALQPVIDWAKKVWTEMFPPGVNFDIVRAIIDAFGEVGKVFGDVVNGIKIMYAKFGILGAIVGIVNAPVQAIVGVLRLIICALLGCSPGIVPALQTVQEVFTSVWEAIAGFIGGVISSIVSAIQPIINILSQIANFYLESFMYAWQTVIMVFNIVSMAVNRIINIFSLFLSGQINLQTMLTMIWNTLTGMFASVFNTIISRVTSFASKMVTKALAMARQFVNNIITNVKQLPGKVYSALLTVVSKIRSAIQSWITAATSKVKDLISKITSPFSGVASSISSALSGVASALLEPFKDAWSWIKPYYDKIKSALDIIPGGAAGGEFLAAGGEETITTTPVVTGNVYSTPKVDNSPIEVDHNLNLNFSFDFKDVPSHINTQELANALTDKTVIRELVNNKDFQILDGKAKERLNLKVNRARGI